MEIPLQRTHCFVHLCGSLKTAIEILLLHCKKKNASSISGKEQRGFLGWHLIQFCTRRYLSKHVEEKARWGPVDF